MSYKVISSFVAGILLSACAPSIDHSYDDEYGYDCDECYQDDKLTNVNYDNEYSYIDSYKPKTEEEVLLYADKWGASNVETKWQNYKGVMVRSQIINGDRDLREMKLRVYESANGGNIDGDSQFILGKTSEYLMKQICGRNSKSVMVVYEKPAYEVSRPNPFFDYRITAEGATLREYGFRCVY